MDDYIHGSLSYGHLGGARYSDEKHKWLFTRALLDGVSLRLEGGTEVYSFSNETHTQGNHTGNERFDDEYNSLISEFPELAYGLKEIVLEEPSAEAVVAVQTAFEPQRSRCLTMVDAVCMNEDGKPTKVTVPVVISLMVGLNTRLTLHPYRPRVLNTRSGFSTGHTISTDESHPFTSWESPNGTIYQISSNGSVNEGNKLFAARLALATTIFSPSYRRSMFPSTQGNTKLSTDPLGASIIDPNALASIPVSETGGRPHACVDFNPWRPRQIALIDSDGEWSIWNIRKRVRKSGRVAEHLLGGSLSEPCQHSKNLIVDNGQLQKKGHYDGWAAVLWVGDANNLLICNRQNLAICKVDSAPPMQEPVNLWLERSSEWILDVVRGAKDPCSVFVLTNIRVFWLYVTASEVADSGGIKRTSRIHVLLSWRHFRDDEDITLQLVVLSVGNESIIIIYSRLSLLALSFRIALADSLLEPISASVSDGDIFMLPSVSGGEAAPGSNEYFSSVQFKEVAASQQHVESLTGKCVEFFGSLSDGRIVQCLYSVETNYGCQQEKEDAKDELEHKIDPSLFYRKGPPLSRAKVVEDSDYVVDDMNWSSLVTISRHNDEVPRVFNTPSQEIEEWQNIYAFATSTSSSSCSRFQDWINTFQIHLCQLLEENSTKLTAKMDEVSPLLYPVGDIDEMTTTFNKLLEGILEVGKSYSYDFLVLPLPTAASSNFSTANLDAPQLRNLSLLSLYDSLVRKWITVLPDETPYPVRLATEKTIRSIVTDIQLARVSVLRLPNNQPKNQVSTPAVEMGDDGVPLSQPEKKSTAKSLRTEALASVIKYETLRRYTAVHKPPANTVRGTRISSHWACGGDPADYSWSTAVAAQQYSAPSSQSRNKRASKKRREQGEVYRKATDAVPTIQIGMGKPKGKKKIKKKKRVAGF